MKQEYIFRALAELLSDYESLLIHFEKRWPSLPEGFLRFRKKHENPYYFRVLSNNSNRTEVAIPNQTAHGKHLLQSLLEKHIIKHSHSQLQKNIKTIRAMLSKLTVYDPESLISKLGGAECGLILPDSVFLPGQLNVGKWIEDTKAGLFQTNPAYPEELKYKTRQGHRVRSKSEVFWDDALLDINAVYRFENALVLKNGKVVYPDFTVLLPEEKRLVIIEHFGRMDDPRYAMKNMRKLQDYAESGYIPGRDVFFTMETKAQPLTSTQIKAVLRKIGL